MYYQDTIKHYTPALSIQITIPPVPKYFRVLHSKYPEPEPMVEPEWYTKAMKVPVGNEGVGNPFWVYYADHLIPFEDKPIEVQSFILAKEEYESKLQEHSNKQLIEREVEWAKAYIAAVKEEILSTSDDVNMDEENSDEL